MEEYNTELYPPEKLREIRLQNNRLLQMEAEFSSQRFDEDFLRGQSQKNRLFPSAMRMQGQDSSDDDDDERKPEPWFENNKAYDKVDDETKKKWKKNREDARKGLENLQREAYAHNSHGGKMLQMDIVNCEWARNEVKRLEKFHPEDEEAIDLATERLDYLEKKRDWNSKIMKDIQQFDPIEDIALIKDLQKGLYWGNYNGSVASCEKSFGFRN